MALYIFIRVSYMIISIMSIYVYNTKYINYYIELYVLLQIVTFGCGIMLIIDIMKNNSV